MLFSGSRLGTTMEPSEIVQLNIGGTGYTTTMKTLSREPDSFFPQLFAKEGLERYSHVASKMADGSIFVDRDGELFVYILDYLRSGKLILPDNFKETARLREEVVFYQLEGLSQLLTPYYNLKYPTKALAINGGSVVPNAIGESGKPFLNTHFLPQKKEITSFPFSLENGSSENRK